MAATPPAPIRPAIIAKKLRHALEALGQSPGWLSQRTGIGQTTIYSILSGRHMASPAKLAAISEVLSISVDELLDIEPHLLSLYPASHAEGQVYASFERIWLGESGGERISVSRGFSVANQSEELRRAILCQVYRLAGEALETAMHAFRERVEVIRKLEHSRIEIVVESEIEDFVSQRKPWGRIDPALIRACIEGIKERIENDRDHFKVIVIPRERFLVNYEIINREVILFDAGTVFLRHSHPRILEHFLSEVEQFKSSDALHQRQGDLICWLNALLDRSRSSD